MMNKVDIGRILFKWRSFSLLPVVILIVFIPPEIKWSMAIKIIFLSLILFFELIRIWAVGYAGSITRTRNSYVPELVVAGPFRYVRNPLYIANISIYTLVGLLLGYYFLSLFIFIYSFLQYSFIVTYEENLLEKTFKEKYINYKKTVPRWIFHLKPAPSTGHEFNLLRAIRSERSSFFIAILIFAIYIIKN